MRAKFVDCRRRSGFELVGGLIVEGLPGVHLSFRCFDARFVGDGLKIVVTDCENDEIPGVFERVLRGFHTLRGGVRVINGFPIEDGLSYVSARIVISERADDGGNTSRQEF